MKNKKQLIYLAYYAVLFTVLATKVVQTVYTGSLYVHRSHQLSSLNAEKQVLSESNYQLTTELSKANSLHSLLSSDTLDGYREIKNPIVITDKAMVALK
ncbi:MAG: hypothetical protein GW941_01455 [Candidatus Pacebacteria bacterium]|nr:hypothetical protein [Candidatus Paceibacterota bacterium]